MHAPPLKTTTLRGGPPRIALAHDWLVGYRGGEAVLHHIVNALRSARADGELGPIFTLFDNGEPLSGAIDDVPRRASVLGRLPFAATTLRRWLLPLYPAGVRDLSRQLAREHAQRPIDLLVSTSSAGVKNLAPPPGVPHLCYCHTPPRYVWSQARQYGGGLRGLGLGLFGPALRAWDRESSGVTRFLANSTHTAGEIRRCYGRDADVLFPPVRTGFFTPDASIPRGDHWLVVGALEPYKRFDLAIAAANALGHPLTVVGGGSEQARLRSMAGPTVTFAGRVDDERLRREYRTARCLLFPQVEDFGIVAVEALACGTPVVARAAGGALDTVDDETGSLFSESSVDALTAAIRSCPAPGPVVAAACRASAERFSTAAFEAGFLHAVEAIG
ncbi:MAG: glycosyltransferase [Planctomycetota bacterium]